MPDPGREIRFRMTARDWSAWAEFLTPAQARTAEWRVWFWYLLEWTSAVFSYAVWAYLTAGAVSLIVGPQWWNLGFLLGFLGFAGLFAWRDHDKLARLRAVQDFEKSIHARYDAIVRIDPAALEAEVGNVSIRLPWTSVTAVRHGETITLVCYDDLSSGIVVPRHAFADQPAMDAFLAAIEAYRSAARASAGICR